jgi:hypothetical protein
VYEISYHLDMDYGSSYNGSPGEYGAHSVLYERPNHPRTNRHVNCEPKKGPEQPLVANKKVDISVIGGLIFYFRASTLYSSTVLYIHCKVPTNNCSLDIFTRYRYAKI